MDVDEAERKREADGGTSTNSTVKRQRQTDTEMHSDAKNDDVGEEILAWLTLDDEAISELLNFLDPNPNANPNPYSNSNYPGSTTTAAPAVGNFKVKFIEHPYSSRLICRSSSSYVTINGNEESCGSSFSVLDSDSSLMASIDTRGVNFSLSNGISVGKETKLSPEDGSAWGCLEEEEAFGWLKEYGGADDGVVEGFDELVWEEDDDVFSGFVGEEVFNAVK